MAMKRHATVDDYLAAESRWREELSRLRAILLSAGLEETVKWGAPVYTFAGKNVVGLAGFKEHFGLWFFQGALLADPEGVLVNAQEGRTRAMRQLRYASAAEIDPRLVETYVAEAIELARRGKAVKARRGRPLVVPAELEAALEESPDLRRAFEGLPLGKRREYAEHVASAKRDDTRARRLAKILPMIKAGVGLHDRYR